MSSTQAHERLRRFLEGSKNVNNVGRYGRHATRRTKKIIEGVLVILREKINGVIICDLSEDVQAILKLWV